MNSEEHYICLIKKHYQRLVIFYSVVDFLLWRIRKKVAQIIGQGCKIVLDVACGTGSQAYTLVKKGHAVYGIDISRAMLDKTRRKQNPDGNIYFVEGDIRELPFKDSYFDASIISFALHEILYEGVVETLREMKRVTKRDGKLVIVELNPTKTLFSRLVFSLLKIIEPVYFQSYTEKGLDTYLAELNSGFLSQSFYYFNFVQAREYANRENEVVG